MLDADLPFGIIRIAMLTANWLLNDGIITSRRTTHVVILLRMGVGLLLHMALITPGERHVTRVSFTAGFLPPT